MLMCNLTRLVSLTYFNHFHLWHSQMKTPNHRGPEFPHLDLWLATMPGKSYNKIYSPNGGEFNGDESHGIESVKNHEQKQRKAHSWWCFGNTRPLENSLTTVLMVSTYLTRSPKKSQLATLLPEKSTLLVGGSFSNHSWTNMHKSNWKSSSNKFRGEKHPQNLNETSTLSCRFCLDELQNSSFQ